jgi:hypothetical protein
MACIETMQKCKYVLHKRRQEFAVCERIFPLQTGNPAKNESFYTVRNTQNRTAHSINRL